MFIITINKKEYESAFVWKQYEWIEILIFILLYKSSYSFCVDNISIINVIDD